MKVLGSEIALAQSAVWGYGQEHSTKQRSRAAEGRRSGPLRAASSTPPEILHNGVGWPFYGRPTCAFESPLSNPITRTGSTSVKVEGPHRPAEAAAEPPSGGDGGLKQYRGG